MARRPWRTLRLIGRNLALEYRARRAYRELCDCNCAPLVNVDIRLDLDRGDDWSGMTGWGMTGLKTRAIPLTPEGIDYIDGIVRSMRRTCLNQLRHDIRERDREAMVREQTEGRPSRGTRG